MMNDATIVCPGCSGGLLHHETVTVYSRKAEDEDGIKTTVRSARLSRSSVVEICGEDEMPGRRDGLTINFWCETCDAKPELLIFQHKGQTLFCWLNGEVEGGVKFL